MSTGSSEWWDIKTEFEVCNDTVAGMIWSLDHNQRMEPTTIHNHKMRLQRLGERIDDYKLKDETEARELGIVQRKVNAGLKIYDIILNSSG